MPYGIHTYIRTYIRTYIHKQINHITEVAMQFFIEQLAPDDQVKERQDVCNRLHHAIAEVIQHAELVHTHERNTVQ
jgi:hypothetical protein